MLVLQFLLQKPEDEEVSFDPASSDPPRAAAMLHDKRAAA